MRVLSHSVRCNLRQVRAPCHEASHRGGNRQKVDGVSSTDVARHAKLVNSIISRRRLVAFVQEASAKFCEYTEIVVRRLCRDNGNAQARVLHVAATLLSLCITWNTFFGGETGSTTDALLFFKTWCRECVNMPSTCEGEMPTMKINPDSSDLANLKGILGTGFVCDMEKRFGSEFQGRVNEAFKILRSSAFTLQSACTFVRVVSQHVGGAIAARESTVNTAASTGAILCCTTTGLVAFGTTFMPTIENTTALEKLYRLLERHNTQGCHAVALAQIMSTDLGVAARGLTTTDNVAIQGAQVVEVLVRLSQNTNPEIQQDDVAALVDQLGVGISVLSKKERAYRTNHCQPQGHVLCSFEPYARLSDLPGVYINQMVAMGTQYWVDAMHDSEMHTASLSVSHARHFLLEALLTMGLTGEIPDTLGIFPVPLPDSPYATRILSGWANSGS